MTFPFFGLSNFILHGNENPNFQILCKVKGRSNPWGVCLEAFPGTRKSENIGFASWVALVIRTPCIPSSPLILHSWFPKAVGTECLSSRAANLSGCSGAIQPIWQEPSKHCWGSSRTSLTLDFAHETFRFC